MHALAILSGGQGIMCQLDICTLHKNMKRSTTIINHTSWFFHKHCMDIISTIASSADEHQVHRYISKCIVIIIRYIIVILIGQYGTLICHCFHKPHCSNEPNSYYCTKGERRRGGVNGDCGAFKRALWRL